VLWPLVEVLVRAWGEWWELELEFEPQILQVTELFDCQLVEAWVLVLAALLVVQSVEAWEQHSEEASVA